MNSNRNRPKPPALWVLFWAESYRKLQEKKMAILERFFQSERAEIFEKAKNRKAMSEETKPITGVPVGCLPFDLERVKAGWPVKTRDGRTAKYTPEIRGHPSLLVFAISDTTGNFITAQVGLNGRYYQSDHASNLDLFLVAPPTPPETCTIDTTASAGRIVKLLDPDEKQQIIDLVAEHFGLRAAAAEPEAGAETEAGTEEPWVVTPAIDLCLRLKFRAEFDQQRPRRDSEIREDLLKFFSTEEIDRASSLAREGWAPPKVNLDLYRR